MTTAREALRYLTNVAEAFAADDEGLTLDANTWNKMRASILALRSSVQEEPAARAVAINDALDTGLAVHLRKARAFLEGVSDQLEQAEYCASTLPQSAQNNAEAQHEVGNTQPEHGAAVSGPAAASAPFARNDTQRSECKHPQCRNDSGDCEGRCAELDRAEDFRVLNQQRCAEAMQLLYQTYIIDAKIAEDRGHAIQAINRMILALGGEDTAAKIEAVPYTARLLESGEPELVQLAKDLKGAI